MRNTVFCITVGLFSIGFTAACGRAPTEGALVHDGVTYVPLVDAEPTYVGKFEHSTRYGIATAAESQIGLGGAQAVAEAQSEPEPPEAYAREDMTEYELAMALRTIMPGSDGQAVVAEEPNWAAAEATLLMDPTETLQIDGESIPEFPEMETQYVFGTDDRVIPPNQNPYRWMVYIATTQGTCSGVWIGWHTIITAAHCVYYPLSNSYQSNFVFSTRTASGSVSYALSDANRAARIKIPAGFDDNTQYGDEEWDYAVINLDGLYTSPTGWNGFMVNQSGNTYQMYGIPNSAPYNCPPHPTVHGFLCGMSGAGRVNGFMVESWEVDSTDGQSGGPWMAPTDHTVGVHTGSYVTRCGFLGQSWCWYSYGRRLDSTFWTFIQSNSPDH